MPPCPAVVEPFDEQPVSEIVYRSDVSGDGQQPVAQVDGVELQVADVLGALGVNRDQATARRCAGCAAAPMAMPISPGFSGRMTPYSSLPVLSRAPPEWALRHRAACRPACLVSGRQPGGTGGGIRTHLWTRAMRRNLRRVAAAGVMAVGLGLTPTVANATPSSGVSAVIISKVTLSQRRRGPGRRTAGLALYAMPVSARC